MSAEHIVGLANATVVISWLERTTNCFSRYTLASQTASPAELCDIVRGSDAEMLRLWNLSQKVLQLSDTHRANVSLAEYAGRDKG